MNFDQFLLWHQKIIAKRDTGKDITEEALEFITMIEVKIDSYCEIADKFSRDYEIYNQKAERLTKLRDMFKPKEKKDG